MLIHVDTTKPVCKPIRGKARQLSKALQELAKQLADCILLQVEQNTISEIKQLKQLKTLAIKQISSLQVELKLHQSYKVRHLEILTEAELQELDTKINQFEYAIKQTASQSEADLANMRIERITELGGTGKLVFMLTSKQLVCRHELNGVSIVIFQSSIKLAW